MQDHCSRMKIQAISIALECSKQAATKPLRDSPPQRAQSPESLSDQLIPLRDQPGEPCLPDTWPMASALAPRRACLPGRRPPCGQ